MWSLARCLVYALMSALYTRRPPPHSSTFVECTALPTPPTIDHEPAAVADGELARSAEAEQAIQVGRIASTMEARHVRPDRAGPTPAGAGGGSGATLEGAPRSP